MSTYESIAEFNQEAYEITSYFGQVTRRIPGVNLRVVWYPSGAKTALRDFEAAVINLRSQIQGAVDAENAVAEAKALREERRKQEEALRRLEEGEKGQDPIEQIKVTGE